MKSQSQQLKIKIYVGLFIIFFGFSFQPLTLLARTNQKQTNTKPDTTSQTQSTVKLSTNRIQQSINTKTQSKFSYWDLFKFSQIPILHAGRVKPLSTFAREYLLVLYEKSSLPNMSAEEWLVKTVFDPKTSQNLSIFKIRNPEIIDILNMKKNTKSIYSFNELSKALDQMIDQLNEIKNKPEEDRELTEKQLWNLYIKALSYFQLNRSLFMILPLFSLESPTIAKKLGMKPNTNYSYLEMIRFQQKINEEISQFKTTNFKQLPKGKQKLVLLSYRMDILSKNENNRLLKIIPPQWEENKELWHSPWGLISEGRGSPLSAAYMDHWIRLEKAFRTGSGWRSAGEAAYQQSIKISTKFSNPSLLFMEKIFNDIQFFQKSLILYIMAFLFLLLSLAFWKNLLYKISFVTLIGGFAFHLTGMLFRMSIMRRPPVSTLYESVLFVGLISVGLALLMEKYNPHWQKNQWKDRGLGIFTGSLAGAVLHFIALKYKGTESMSLLVPVLNTNFWLATHVTCITIGYAGAIFSSLMGHIYMFLKCFNNGSSADRIYKIMNNSVFFALFFCLFGTILGGIWADQSWGRFWGWDPKENGALSIVIWLLVLIHGRLAGLLEHKEFAVGMILTNIIVALSWFGVNLLNVGLHSYGFIQGILWGLIIFCGVESLLALTAYIYLTKYEKLGKGRRLGNVK